MARRTSQGMDGGSTLPSGAAQPDLPPPVEASERSKLDQRPANPAHRRKNSSTLPSPRRSAQLIRATRRLYVPPPHSVPAAWVELVRLAARDRTDAAIAKPETPFVRVDELGGQFPGMPGAPSHGQNRGLAVGAADQAPRACDSAHGLTGKERAISRLVAPGSRVTSEPDPTTVSRSAPFIRSEPCVCRRVRGWDLEFESGLLQRRVCELSVPPATKRIESEQFPP